MAQHILHYGTTAIHYDVIYRPRKTLAIHVHPDRRVIVEAPETSTLEQIEQKVRQRAAWILKQQRAFEQHVIPSLPREYVSGETHRYLGRQYRLRVEQSATRRESARLSRGRILIYVREMGQPERVQRLLEGWYRKQARRVFQERLDLWYPRLARYGIARPAISVRKMTSQWGSCTAAGKISLNLTLIQMPVECIEYVIVHELCHLKEHNHSPAFYALLDRVMPDWRERKGKLNTHPENIGQSY